MASTTARPNGSAGAVARKIEAVAMRVGRSSTAPTTSTDAASSREATRASSAERCAPSPAMTSRHPSRASPDAVQARRAVSVSFSASRRWATSTTRSRARARLVPRHAVEHHVGVGLARSFGHEPADGDLGVE